MIRSLSGLSLILFVAVIYFSCSSGKSAYKHGDYYDAVLTAVNRLRQNPDHKKSREVLNLSYQAAVSFLEADAKNQIDANANFKWRTVVQDYQRINNLYEQIRTSPGAMKVVTNPVNKYKELTEAKGKAAEEVYEAGVQAMMKNTRTDAKQAYFLFKESESYSPGFREAIEMTNQAEYNATFRVSFEETNASRENFSLQPAINNTQRQFLKFYTTNEALNTKDPIDQRLKLVYKGCYVPELPSAGSTTEEVEKDIQVGEKTVNGKKEPVMEKVKAKVTTHTLSATASCASMVQITDIKAGSILADNQIDGKSYWQYSWATYTGDVRALSNAQKELIKKNRTLPQPAQMINDARQDLTKSVTNHLRNFYNQY
jgi:hypothetical protein